MALPRKWLKERIESTDLTNSSAVASLVDEILTKHGETVDVFRERAENAEEALATANKQLSGLKDESGKTYKEKYEALEKEHNDYKAEQKAKETATAKREAYRKLLKETGVSEKYADDIMRITDLNGIELDEKGGIKDAKKASDGIKSKYSSFIVKEKKQGANTATPPNHTDKPRTREEIYRKDEHGHYVLDAQSRQHALAEMMAAGTSE